MLDIKPSHRKTAAAHEQRGTDVRLRASEGVRFCRLKKYNLKSYVLFIGNVWTSSQERASQVSLRDLLRGGKEGSQVIYIKRSFATKGRQSECQKVVVVCLKKTRYPKLRDLVLFYVRGEARAGLTLPLKSLL